MRDNLHFAIRYAITEWLEENGKEATPEEIENMGEGVKFWFMTNVADSIDTAYDVVKGESAQTDAV